MKQSAYTLLLTSRHGQVRSMQWHPRRMLWLATLLLGLLVTLLLWQGFRLGVDHEAQRQLSEIGELQRQAGTQADELDRLRTLAQSHLDALTLRLGRMQAQILRIDALGERLVAQSGLDADEFDFSIDPPVGGPADNSGLAATGVPDFIGMIGELDAGITDRSRKLTALEKLLQYRNFRDRVTPSGQAVEHGVLSSRFGKRIDPFTGKHELHEGVDIAGKRGAQILAVGDGVVTWSGRREGYGNLVEIEHGNGLVTRYGHNESNLVEAGDVVRKGQTVAHMGSTGRSTGPHVHIEVLRDGTPVNPAGYLAD